MKVYVKVWTNDPRMPLRALPAVEIDQYNGVGFVGLDRAVCKDVGRLHVEGIYMHASERGALVVYAREEEGV